jgi:hypothetical protein
VSKAESPSTNPTLRTLRPSPPPQIQQLRINGLAYFYSALDTVQLNENNGTITVASLAGFRCFTSITEFKKYVQSEVLTEEAAI